MLSSSAEAYFELFEKNASEFEGAFEKASFWWLRRGVARQAGKAEAQLAKAERVGRKGEQLTEQAKATDVAAGRALSDEMRRSHGMLGPGGQAAAAKGGYAPGAAEELAAVRSAMEADARRLADLQANTAGLKQRAEAAEAALPGWGSRLGWGALGVGGTGGGLYGGHALGQHLEEKRQKSRRALAFGGGLATGLAAPKLLQGVNQLVSNQGFLPGSGGGYGGGYNFQSI